MNLSLRRVSENIKATARLNQHFKLNVHCISQSLMIECPYNNHRASVFSFTTASSLCAVNYTELQWWETSAPDENAESQRVMSLNQKNLQQWNAFTTALTWCAHCKMERYETSWCQLTTLSNLWNCESSATC